MANSEILNTEDILSKIKNSNQWRILVYGVRHSSYTAEQNEYHLRLLSGILGEEISTDKQTQPSFSLSKNTVRVTVFIGSNTECRVSPDDVDLLLYFLPMDRDAMDKSYVDTIEDITRVRSSRIWKHSVVVFTGVDVIVTEYNRRIGAIFHISTRLEQLLSTAKTHFQQAESLKDFAANIVFFPAGRQDQPDLLKSHEKWFSQVWFGCFEYSEVKSMPAVLKFAQDRISNAISCREVAKIDFHQQQILVKEDSVDLRQNSKVKDYLRPSPLQRAHYRDYAPVENSASELKLCFAYLPTCIPKICGYLRGWASKQINCSIVVTGVKGEGVSTAAASLVEHEPKENLKGFYWKQVVEMKANLHVHDFQGFSEDSNMQEETTRLARFLRSKGASLLVVCIPMTSSKDSLDLASSLQFKHLGRLCELVEDILSNTVIALTHANKMRAEMEKNHLAEAANFHQSFKNELREWKKQIRTVFKKFFRNKKDEVVDKIPILPVGNEDPTIDLSPNGQPAPATQYHWLTEFFLHAMPATKPEGLSTLITLNKKRIKEQPNDYQDLDQARELVVEAQCLMYSKVGLREENHLGEAIGLILGVNDE